MAPKPEAPLAVYDPRGVVEAAATPLAPRPARLAGLRLGVLDNTKWNAQKLLKATVGLLERDTAFASVTHYKKKNFSEAAAAELIAEIARDNDLVVTAIGD